jgi:DNA-binding beta-propeller fold protein YncE
VLVGAVPTTDGTHVQPPGALFFIDQKGNQISPSPYTNQLDGPWGLTINDQFDDAQVFVSNVLNGTVTRLDLAITPATVTVNRASVIALRYAFRTDPAVVVLGPTGLAYDLSTDTLYVASTADNAIFAVPHAGSRAGSSGTGNIIFQDKHLRGPLALVFAPDGNLITSNCDAMNPDPTQPSEIVGIHQDGKVHRPVQR